jgi:NAD-dependent DNA ligase
METIGFKPKVTTPIKVSPSGKLKGEIVLFTGFHPKDIEAEVIKQGGEIADSWNKKITILVVKDISVSNEKTKKALAAGIPVITAEQLIKKL